MKHAHGERLKDRAKTRRAYLWKSISLRAWSVCAGLIVIVSGILLSLSLFGLIYYFLSPIYWLWLSGLGIICGLGGWLFLASLEKTVSLPHVPPVREQIAALSAEEILVRGSNEPAAAPRELLRAAHEGTEMAVEELLRQGDNPAAGT